MHHIDLKPSVTVLDGYQIHGFEGDYIFLGIKNTGQYYEKDTLQKWTPLIGPAKTVLDIGANLGNHTLYWAKYLKPEKIVSFEPFSSNYEVLQQNISDNGLAQVVTTEMLAIGEAPGYASAASIDMSNLGATAFRQVKEQEDSADTETVPMTSVDCYAQQHQLIVDFMKIDTEGFELSVLKGAENTIARDKPALWIEVSETSHATVRKQLECLGYRVIDIIGFNILFLHQTKTDEKKLFDMENIMDSMFLYQGKCNVYYNNYIKTQECLKIEKEKTERAVGNYETAKKWLEIEKEKTERAVGNYEVAKKWLEIEKEKTERAVGNYETVKKWLEIEKEKTERAVGNYETAKKWLRIEKEKTERAVGNYETAKRCLMEEKKTRISAEMQILQLRFLMQQREEDSYNVQRALTQNIVKANRDLREKTQKLAQTERDLKDKSQKLAQTERDLKDKSQKLAQTEQDLKEESQKLAQTERDLKDKSQKLAKTKRDLKDKSQKLVQAEKNLKKKTLPSIWYTMAGSRVGRTLCKLFRLYHESKRLFR